MAKDIQIAVARADIAIMVSLRVISVIALTIALLLSVLAFRAALGHKEPMIDYDAPGVDITSEGPEDGGENDADTDAHL